MSAVFEVVERIASLARAASADESGVVKGDRGVVGWVRDGHGIEVYKRWGAVAEARQADARTGKLTRDEWLTHPAVFFARSADEIANERGALTHELLFPGADLDETMTRMFAAVKDGSFAAARAKASAAVSGPRPCTEGELVCVADWVLDEDSFTTVLASGVTAEYARMARDAGFVTADALLEAWNAGIPADFLMAMGGAA